MEANSIELFSVEAVLMRAFSAVLAACSIVQFGSYLYPKAVSAFNHRLDAVTDVIYFNFRVLPSFILAAVIAIGMPVVELFIDTNWTLNTFGLEIQAFLSQQGGPIDISAWWRYVLTGGEANLSQVHLVHTIQWLVALLCLYGYSLGWRWCVERIEAKKQEPLPPWARAACLAGFATAIFIISDGVRYMGQHANFLFLE